MYLHYRAGIPDGAETQRVVAPVILRTARMLVVMASVVLVTGTVITGAGPHSGDAGSRATRDLRATRLDLSVPDAARIHGATMVIFLSLVLLTVWLVARHRAPRRAARRLGVLLGLLVARPAMAWAHDRVVGLGVEPFRHHLLIGRAA